MWGQAENPAQWVIEGLFLQESSWKLMRPSQTAILKTDFLTTSESDVWRRSDSDPPVPTI